MDTAQLQQILGSELASSIDLYSLIAMLVFSFIGIVYYRKGKREDDILMLICGIGLFLYGYFVYQLVYLLIIGILLTAIPYLRKFF